MGDKLRKGDKITHVDGLAATQDNVLALLVGKDQPGTSVQITVKSAATARNSTLTLTRAATSQIADRCALYEMFTQLKNKIMKDKVGVGVVPQLDSILHLWSSMIVADEEHDNTVASNITNLQDEERAGLDQLLRLLLELQVLTGVQSGVFVRQSAPALHRFTLWQGKERDRAACYVYKACVCVCVCVCIHI